MSSANKVSSMVLVGVNVTVVQCSTLNILRLKLRQYTAILFNTVVTITVVTRQNRHFFKRKIVNSVVCRDVGTLSSVTYAWPMWVTYVDGRRNVKIALLHGKNAAFKCTFAG